MLDKLKEKFKQYLINIVSGCIILILLSVICYLIGNFIVGTNPILSALLFSIAGSLFGIGTITLIFRVITESSLRQETLNQVDNIFTKTISALLNTTGYLIKYQNFHLNLDINNKILKVTREDLICNIGETVINGRKREFFTFPNEELKIISINIISKGITVDRTQNANLEREEIYKIISGNKQHSETRWKWNISFLEPLLKNESNIIKEETEYNNIEIDKNQYEIKIVQPVVELYFELLITNGTIGVKKVDYDEIDPDRTISTLPPLNYEYECGSLKKIKWKIEGDLLEIGHVYGLKFGSSI